MAPALGAEHAPHFGPTPAPSPPASGSLEGSPSAGESAACFTSVASVATGARNTNEHSAQPHQQTARGRSDPCGRATTPPAPGAPEGAPLAAKPPPASTLGASRSTTWTTQGPWGLFGVSPTRRALESAPPVGSTPAAHPLPPGPPERAPFANEHAAPWPRTCPMHRWAPDRLRLPAAPESAAGLALPAVLPPAPGPPERAPLAGGRAACLDPGVLRSVARVICPVSGVAVATGRLPHPKACSSYRSRRLHQGSWPICRSPAGETAPQRYSRATVTRRSLVFGRGNALHAAEAAAGSGSPYGTDIQPTGRRSNPGGSPHRRHRGQTSLFQRAPRRSPDPASTSRYATSRNWRPLGRGRIRAGRATRRPNQRPPPQPRTLAAGSQPWLAPGSADEFV